MARISKIEFTLVGDEASADITKSFGIFLNIARIPSEIENSFGPKAEELGLFASRAEACDDSYHGESVTALIDALQRDRDSAVELLISEGFDFTPGSNMLKIFLRAKQGSSFVASTVKHREHRKNSNAVVDLTGGTEESGATRQCASASTSRHRLSQADYIAIESVLEILWPWSSDGLPLPARLSEKDKATSSYIDDDDGASMVHHASPNVVLPWVKLFLERLLKHLRPEAPINELMESALRFV